VLVKMLNLYTYGNLAFRGAAACKITPLNEKENLNSTRKVKNTHTPPLRTGGIEEGVTRYNHLAKNRPVMLSHTSINCADWLSQFDTTDEKNLALKILQHYTYIDIENARKAFRKIHTELEDEIDLGKTKFATLGTAKSGSMMGYLYRQANKMRSKGTVHHKYTDSTGIPTHEQFLTSTQLQDTKLNAKLQRDGYENIVIVDDIIGDGDSLIEYFTPELVESLQGYENIYYVTLLKDPDGEKKVKETFPDLNIKFKCAKEVHKYDSPENTDFTDIEKMQIKKLVAKYGNRIAPELVNKYSRSKLFVSFDWNTPGNTPMIFNYSTPEWNGLFNRFNGLEKGEVGTKFDFCC